MGDLVDLNTRRRLDPAGFFVYCTMQQHKVVVEAAFLTDLDAEGLGLGWRRDERGHVFIEVEAATVPNVLEQLGEVYAARLEKGK